MGCGYVVCVLLGLGGLGLLWLATGRFEQRRRPDAWIAAGLGVALCAGAVGLIAPMQRAVARAKERARRELERPEEPWTWEPAWEAPGGIEQATRRHARALRVFAVAALVISSPVFFAIGQEVERGNKLVWLALIFPALSLWILGIAVLDAWRRRKYGVARFVSEALPIAWGERVAGMVIVNRPVAAQGTGRVTLECWSTTVSRAGGKRREREEVVSRVEREIAAADWSVAGRESRIFVELPARGGEPTTMGPAAVERPSYEWRLGVRVPTAGADFAAEFVLPVFAVAGRGSVASAAEGESRRAATVDRAEVFRAAEIEEMAQPGARGGMALQLPRAQGRAVVTTPLVMALVFGGIAVALWFSPVPGIFAGFLGAFALLPAIILPELWGGGGERVWVENAELCVQRGTRVVRRVALARVLRIEATKAVGVGAVQFYRVVARTTPKRERHFPGRERVAAMVRGAEAAAEVVAWLEEKLTTNESG